MVLMGVCCRPMNRQWFLPSGGPRIGADHNSSIILHSHDGGLPDRQTGGQTDGQAERQADT